MARAKHAETAGPVSLKRLLPLYAVVFAGFVGYSLYALIGMLIASSSATERPSRLSMAIFWSGERSLAL